jgi:hypothetical protein
MGDLHAYYIAHNGTTSGFSHGDLAMGFQLEPPDVQVFHYQPRYFCPQQRDNIYNPYNSNAFQPASDVTYPDGRLHLCQRK